MTSKAATRRVGGHHIAFATLVIVLLGWAGIGVEPAWLNIDAFQCHKCRLKLRCRQMQTRSPRRPTNSRIRTRPTSAL